METPIFDFVSQYAASGTSRLHMPGHKGTGPLGCESLDITEIQGADSLYEAAGVIAASERNAAALFGAGSTFYSAGGSSQCVKAMLYLALQATGRRTILAARNVHKAFVHAAALLDFTVEWIWPEPYQLLRCDVTAERLEEALRRMKEPPAAVYLTSPDYLGHVQPIEELAPVCHRYGVPLLVDNAHGAYLHFLPVPRHPLDQGADLCCDSAHKTLPVLTGGAYLHMARPEEMGGTTAARQALALFGSTSPSYLILQSLDLCNRYLAGEFPAQLAETLEQVSRLKDQLRAQGWNVADSEPMKIVVRASFATELADCLRQHGVECEYADPDHLVLMASPQNREEDYERIRLAFPMYEGKAEHKVPLSMMSPERVMSIRQALLSSWEEVPVDQAVGRICAAPSVSCPPAVPVVVSGERIRADAAAVFCYYGISSVYVVKER